MKTVKEIAHYAYSLILSSGPEEDVEVENLVDRDLADIENKINEYTNSKLNKIVKKLEEKIDEDIDRGRFGHLKENSCYIGALNIAIEIIKKEITKK